MSACEETRLRLLDYRRGLLPPPADETVRAHLDRCEDCAREDAAAQALTEVLEYRLPQHPAPLWLKRRLAAAQPAARPARVRARRLRPALAAAAVVAALAVALVLVRPAAPPGVDGGPAIAREAVNDHLRILTPGRALDVPSDDVHRVRPWFAGRLDFAPVVAFGGDAEFPLRGGAIEQFLDRRAAVFVYGRRLHTVSLLVYRADGLPAGDDGSPPALLVVRGFNVLLWRAGDLGYALVSDLNPGELGALARRLGARAPAS
jgi:anti-sigma factor RsiW